VRSGRRSKESRADEDENLGMPWETQDVLGSYTIDDGIYPPCSRDRSVRDVHILGTRQILDLARTVVSVTADHSSRVPFSDPMNL
jgi:hypothetical protein